jgi:hypothetical protein
MLARGTTTVNRVKNKILQLISKSFETNGKICKLNCLNDQSQLLKEKQAKIRYPRFKIKAQPMAHPMKRRQKFFELK